MLTFHVSNNNNSLFSSQPSVSSDGTLTYTPAENQYGTTVCTVYVSDDGGTDNGGNDTSPKQTFSISVNNTNDAPTDISLSNSSINENESAGTVVGTFSTSDPDTGDNHTYSLVEGDGDTDNSSFSINGSDLETAEVFDYEVRNSYSIRVETNDGNEGAYEKIFTITINNTNDTPNITSTAPDSATEDIEYTYNPTATDPENGILTWTLANAPDGMTIDSSTGAIQWTPAEGVLTSGEVTLTVTDDGTPALSDSEAFNINVSPVNDTPEIIQLNDTTVIAEIDVSIQVIANDPDQGDTVEYSLFQAPTTMSIDNLSGLIQWLPDETYRGQNEIIVRVVDKNGSFDMDTFVIEVQIQTTQISDEYNTNSNKIKHLSPISGFIAIPNLVSANQDKVSFVLSLRKNLDAVLTIFDCTGNIVFRNIYSLHPDKYNNGNIIFGQWDLTNRYGRKVSAGTYLAILKIKTNDGFIQIAKTSIGIRR